MVTALVSFVMFVVFASVGSSETLFTALHGPAFTFGVCHGLESVVVDCGSR